MTPINTGKVQIGRCYIPPPQRMQDNDGAATLEQARAQAKAAFADATGGVV